MSLRNIMNYLLSKQFYESQLFAGILELLSAVLISIVIAVVFSVKYPELQAKNQQEAIMFQLKQKALVDFSSSITQTISYYEIMNTYSCRRIKASINMAKFNIDSKEYSIYKRQREEADKWYQEYYVKLNALNPSYTVACELIKIYFPERKMDDLTSFQKRLDELLRSDWPKTDDECFGSKKFKAAKIELEEDYNKLLNGIISSFKIKK